MTFAPVPQCSGNVQLACRAAQIHSLEDDSLVVRKAIFLGDDGCAASRGRGGLTFLGDETECQSNTTRLWQYIVAGCEATYLCHNAILFADECRSVLACGGGIHRKFLGTSSVRARGWKSGLVLSDNACQAWRLFVRSSATDEFPKAHLSSRARCQMKTLSFFSLRQHSEYGRSSLSPCCLRSLFSVHCPQILNKIVSLDGSDQPVKERGKPRSV